MKHLDKFNEVNKKSEKYSEMVAMSDPIFYDIGSLGATVRIYCPSNSMGRKVKNLNFIYIREVVSGNSVQNHLDTVSEVMTICERLKDIGEVELRMEFEDAKFIQEYQMGQEGGDDDVIMYHIRLFN